MIFHSSCTVLHSHEQCKKGPTFSTPTLTVGYPVCFIFLSYNSHPHGSDHYPDFECTILLRFLIVLLNMHLSKEYIVYFCKFSNFISRNQLLTEHLLDAGTALDDGENDRNRVGEALPCGADSLTGTMLF